MGRLSQKIVFLFVLISNLRCNTKAMNININWNILNSIQVNDQNVVYLTVDEHNRLKTKNIQMYRSLNNFLISNDFVYIGINGATVKGYYSYIRKNENNDYNKVIVPDQLANEIPIHPILSSMQNLKDQGTALYKDDRFYGEDVSYKIYNKDKNILYYDFKNGKCGFENFDFNTLPKFPLTGDRIYLFPNSLLPDFVESLNDLEKNETITGNQNSNSSYDSLFPHGFTHK